MCIWIWDMNTDQILLQIIDWIKRQVSIDYMVVAGGAGGGRFGGGGGAGGYRASGYGPSPLQGSALSLGLGSYSVTIGGGGAGSTGAQVPGTAGVDSSFSTITSDGGGGGGSGGGPGSQPDFGGDRWKWWWRSKWI